MSQAMEQVGATRASQEFRDFQYKPISPLAPVTAAVGVLSAIGLIWDFAVVFGAAGVVVGLLCLRQIHRSGGTIGGMTLAYFGLVASFLFLVSGSALHAYTYISEVPDGYARVNFTDEISKFEPMVEGKHLKFAPEIASLDNEKIFVKGYMYPTRQTAGLSSFILVKDNKECCFGGQPKLTDMISVQMTDGKTVNYSNQLVSVAGEFRVRKPDVEFNEATLYKMDCRYFSIAATAY